MKKIIFYCAFGLLGSALLYSCKKDKIDSDQPSPTSDRSEQTKDSLFLYAKQVYFWNNQLPSYSAFNPRQYNSGSSQLDNFNTVLFKITQYPINPATGKSYEYYSGYPNEPKYSYIEDVSQSGTLASRKDQAAVDLQGKGSDLGYAIALLSNTSQAYPDGYVIYIKYTHPNSPAAKAGLGRGDYITKINGKTFGANYAKEYEDLKNIFNSDPQSITFTGKRTNGTSFENLNLIKSTYQTSSIFKDTIITVSGSKIGYLAYARFANISTDSALLTQKINQFASSGVNSLVIDLRYNGGGYVNTSQHFANLIAPSSLNGKVMFAEHFNSTMQQDKAKLLENQYLRDAEDNVVFENGKPVKYSDYSYTVSSNTYRFAKKGNLHGVQKVIFLVSEETASASELLINNLKPYMDVKVIGETTYGKPVGFFPIRIDHYDVYYSLFQTKNANNQGDYFSGMAPDKMQFDDFTRDFGNPEELCFADAIKYITTNSLSSTSSAKTMSVKGVNKSATNLEMRDLFSPKKFIGMIEKPRPGSRK